MKHIYIVGYPRSGTTLLQGILSRDKRVCSVPETFFFRRVAPEKGTKTHLGRPIKSAKKGLENLNSYCGPVRRRPIQLWLSTKLLTFSYRYYRQTTLEYTKRKSAEIFLEKTPMHVLYIAHMIAATPQSRIIHVVRNPLDSIASLLDVSRKYPEQWIGNKDSKTCVEFWKKCALQTINWCKTDSRNDLLTFDNLIENPSTSITRIASKYGSTFTSGWLRDEKATSSGIINNDEPWKSASTSSLYKPKSKADLTLSKEEQDFVLSETSALWQEVAKLEIQQQEQNLAAKA